MRYIGFDGVGVPGLDQYPSGLQGVVFFCASWRPVVFPCTLEYQASTVQSSPTPDAVLSLINTLGSQHCDRASDQHPGCAQQKMLTTILVLLALGGVMAGCLYTPDLVRALLYAGPLFLWE